MLRQVSGFRGAMLTFLPLLLIVATVLAGLLMVLIIDTSAQLILWIVSWLLFTTVACVCYLWIYRCRNRTRILLLDTSQVLQLTAPFLGVWNFPLKRLIAYQAYTAETASIRKRHFIRNHIVGMLVLCTIPFFIDMYILILMLPLILIGYPLVQMNKPSPFQSGIVLFFAKNDNLASRVHSPMAIHVCANDTIIQYLVGIAKPIVEQNSKMIAN